MMNVAAILVQAAIIADEEMEDEGRIIAIENRRRNAFIRNLANPFQTMSDAKFQRKFRLSKQLTRWLCDEISPHIPDEGEASWIPKDIQVLATLRFYATGSFQEGIGESSWASVSQPTMSRIINNVTNAILTLEEEFIQFPHEREELQRISAAFEIEIGFPGVIGAIDCTHIALGAPREEKWNYLNHNRYYSINVQVTCDDKCRVTSIDGYPGTTHDARIWRNSEVKAAVNRYNNRRDDHFYLIGDSGYPLQSSILTPFANAQDDTPEAAYNESFVHTRSIIERVFGMIKGRWRCVYKSRTLLYQPERAYAIFKACAILHNVLIAHREEIAEGGDEHEERNEDSASFSDENDDGTENENEMEEDDNGPINADDDDDEEMDARGRDELRRGQQLRNDIIQEYFTNN